MRRFPRTDDDFPIRQFVLQFSRNLRGKARDNQLPVLHLVLDAALLDEWGNLVGHELARRPGGHHRKTLRVLDQQIGRRPAGLHLARDDEVGEREVRGDQHRRVLVRPADLVHPLLGRHRPLRVGEDVQPLQKQRKERCPVEVGEHHQTDILGDQRRGDDRLLQRIVGHLPGKGDGGKTQRLALSGQGRPADGDLVLEGRAQLLGPRVDHQILQPHPDQLLGHPHQLLDPLPARADRAPVLLGQGPDLLDIVLVGRVDQRLLVRANLKSGAQRLRAGADQDHPQPALGHLARQGGEFLRIPLRLLHGHHLGSQVETHPVVLQLIHLVDPGFHLGVVHRIGDQQRQRRRVDEGLLVAEHHGLATGLERAPIDADAHRADGRFGRFRQLPLGFFRHVRTLLQLGFPLGKAHGKSQTGGKAAVLAVGLG